MLIITQVLEVGPFYLLIVKTKTFVILFNTKTNEFIKDPLYINSDINEKIAEIKACSFGDIPGNFIAISYINFNDLALTTSAKLLITPVDQLDKHSTFVKVLISTVGPVDHFHINEKFLAASYFNSDGNHDVLKYSPLQGIAAQSSDLDALSGALNSNLKEMPIEGNVTYIDGLKGNLFVGLSQNRFLILDSVSGQSRIFNNEGSINFMKDISPEGSQMMNAILLTKSGDLSVANIANDIEKPTWSNLNMPVLRAHCVPFNQGKF